jgi:hypothetical protein
MAKKYFIRKSKNRNVKKGIFFSLDALIAAILILSVTLFISYFYFDKKETSQPVYFSSDLISLLSNIKLNEFDDLEVKAFIEDNNIEDLNRTILEQVLRFQIEGEEEKATELLNLTLEGLVPDYYKVGVWIEDYEAPIYSTGPQNAVDLISAKEMISGLEKNRTVEGTATRVFLSNINERTTASYVYFGGYEGEGNISKKIFLPDVITSVASAYFELDSGSNFSLYVNGIFSGYYNISGPGVLQVQMNQSYLTNFHAGENNLLIIFNGSNKYIGGGYLKVNYNTNEIVNHMYSGQEKYYFPGINGIINVYSSFYIPGTINYMYIVLHYRSGYEVFLTIGDKEVFNHNSSIETVTNITDGELIIKLNYSQISNKTIPVRIALRNVSYRDVGFGGTADSVLITDVSRSMNDCVEYNYTLMCTYDCCQSGVCPDSYSCPSITCSNQECGSCGVYNINCTYDCIRTGYPNQTISCFLDRTCKSQRCGDCPSRYSDVNYRTYPVQTTPQNYNPWTQSTCLKSKLDVAKEADKEFVDVVLQTPGNRVGLVSYSTTTKRALNLTNNTAKLYSEINNYTVDDSTCICCGVVNATTILRYQSTGSRSKSMLVMTDGEANEGCNIAFVPDYDGDGRTTNDPQDQAIQAACNAKNLYNITVYTVGFGSITSAAQETLDMMADCGGGRYTYSNATNLTTIYQGIARELVNLSYNLTQTLASSERVLNSTLYSDSYIYFNYTPFIPENEYDRIPITIETPIFNNNITNGSVYFPSNVFVYDAKLTSYSGNKWTDKARIRNSGNWTTFYNLSDYGSEYHLLGDPFIVNVPARLIISGNNDLMIGTGISKANSTQGSSYDRLIYTAGIDLTINYTGVFEKSEGCNWLVKFEDRTNSTLAIPSSYLGGEQCNFTNTTNCALAFEDDSVNNAVCYLFKQLDFDNDGELYVKFDSADLNIDTYSIGGIPYMWGPTVVEVRVWK